MQISAIKIMGPRETCPKCGETLSLAAEIGGRETTLACACACQRKGYEAAEERRRAAYEVEQRARRMVRAFGDRVPQGDFERADGRNAGEMDTCRRYAEKFGEIKSMDKNGLLLVGKTRVGKTYAAEAVAMHLHRRGLSVLMDTAAGFVQRTQDREPGLGERIARCDLLVVDDLGASRDTSFGNEAILSVIDARVSARRPMVITANVLPGGPDIATQRLYGRIAERCYLVRFSEKKEAAKLF